MSYTLKMYHLRDGNSVYSETNPKAKLNDLPHYTDSRFREAQVIYGKEKKGLDYVYSDRLWQWNYDKAQVSSKYATDRAKLRTAEWYQIYLSEYYGKSIELVCILAGYNLSRGYTFQFLGYTEKDKKG